MIKPDVDESEFIRLSKLGKGPSKSMEFTYVGRLISLKMAGIGIHAFAKISKLYLDAVFNIVGNRPIKSHLKKLIEEVRLCNKVIFYGNQLRMEAVKILSISKVLVMTSCKEDAAWELFEAMMC